MKTISVAILSLLIFLSVADCQKSSCYKDAGSQQQVKDCAASEFKRADLRMNETYTGVLTHFSHDEKTLQRAKVAQRAWLVFRDAQVEAAFPEDELGSAREICRIQELTRLTIARTRELEALFKHVEGDVCTH